MAQTVGRGIALLFHDRGTRRGWVVSSTPWPQFTPGKDRVPTVQEAGWAPEPVWTGGKSRPHRNSTPDRSARSSVAIPTELPGPHTLNVPSCNKYWPEDGLAKPKHVAITMFNWLYIDIMLSLHKVLYEYGVTQRDGSYQNFSYIYCYTENWPTARNNQVTTKTSNPLSLITVRKDASRRRKNCAFFKW